MWHKMVESIKKFYKELCSDLKKINILAVFTTPSLLIISILLLLAIILVFANLNTLFVVKGILSGLILYFIFLWRK